MGGRTAGTGVCDQRRDRHQGDRRRRRGRLRRALELFAHSPEASLEAAEARCPRIYAVPFTLRNLKEDLEDIGSRFDGAPDLEFRLATEALELEKSGLSYQRVPPGYRFPYGHTHETQEEVYVVVRGSGRMKLDDEIVELREWDAVRVPPGTWRGYEAGPRASRSSSSARPVSARLGAKTSTAGATGGLTSRRQSRRRIVSSISSPRPCAKPRSTPTRRNPAFSRTRSEPTLSEAARAYSGRSAVSARRICSAALAMPFPHCVRSIQ